MALDDDKQCLYVGTSNGLFRLNLKDGSTSHELTPIQLGKCSKNCGVNKVVIKEKKLYVASEQGLFVVRNLEKDFKRPVIDSLVTNVSVYNDTVYALLENSVFKISPDGKRRLYAKDGVTCMLKDPTRMNGLSVLILYFMSKTVAL